MITDASLRVCLGSLRNLKSLIKKGNSSLFCSYTNTMAMPRKHFLGPGIVVLPSCKNFGLDGNNFQRFQSSVFILSSCGQSRAINVRCFSTNINDANEDSWEQNPSNSNGGQKLSNRSLFKAIPVNPSILEYIKSVGVGIRSQKKKKRTSKQKNANGGILNEVDEKEYFVEKYGTRRIRKTLKRPILGEGETIVRSEVIPPPPFSSQLPSGDKDVNENGNQIKRLPLKVLGSVGSSEEKMPKSSKGLAEVAIVGRSNVGKSTLLNVSVIFDMESLG
jgi:Predicted GTPase